MNRVSLAEPKEEPLTCSGLFVQILDLSTCLPFCVKTVLNHRKTNRQLAGIPSPFASSLCSNRRGYSSVMAQNWELNCKVRPAPSCPYSCCLAFRSAFAAVLPWQGWLAHSVVQCQTGSGPKLPFALGQRDALSLAAWGEGGVLVGGWPRRCLLGERWLGRQTSGPCSILGGF